MLGLDIMSIRTIAILLFAMTTSCYHAKEKKADLFPLFTLNTQPIAVTVLGDSLSFRSNAFSLQEKLGTKYLVRNFAIEGRTTRDWLQEINLVFESQVDILLLELGTNDAIQLAPEEYQKNIQSLIAEIQQRSDAKIFLTAVPITEEASIQARIQQNNSWLHSFAKSSGLPLVDLETEFKQQNEQLDIYPLSDPIHPNPIGYEIIGTAYQKAIVTN